MRQQDLRRVQPEARESRFIRFDQSHLADGGRSLQLVDCRGSRFPPQALHAFRDRAGRHEHDLATAALERRDLVRPAPHGLVIEAATVGRDKARTDLDDDPPRGRDQRGHLASEARSAASSAAASRLGCASSQSWIA